MSASCELIITVLSTEKDLHKIANKLMEMEGPKEYQFKNNPYHPFFVKDNKITAYNFGCHKIWGAYYMDPDVEPYLELAKAAPDSTFEATSSRIYEVGGGGCETYMEASYKDRKLVFKTMKFVDSRTLNELCTDMPYDCGDVDIQLAIIGKSKLFETQEELIEYFEDYDVEIVPAVGISERTTHVVCNNKDSKTRAMQKAKLLHIPVINEAKAIRMFGDATDFDEDPFLIQDVTYADFCANYKIDETITEETFNKMKKDADLAESLILYGDNCVSLVGPWETEEYLLVNDDTIFIKVDA